MVPWYLGSCLTGLMCLNFSIYTSMCLACAEPRPSHLVNNCRSAKRGDSKLEGKQESNPCDSGLLREENTRAMPVRFTTWRLGCLMGKTGTHSTYEVVRGADLGGNCLVVPFPSMDRGSGLTDLEVQTQKSKPKKRRFHKNHIFSLTASVLTKTNYRGLCPMGKESECGVRTSQATLPPFQMSLLSFALKGLRGGPVHT